MTRQILFLMVLVLIQTGCYNENTHFEQTNETLTKVKNQLVEKLELENQDVRSTNFHKLIFSEYLNNSNRLLQGCSNNIYSLNPSFELLNIYKETIKKLYTGTSDSLDKVNQIYSLFQWDDMHSQEEMINKLLIADLIVLTDILSIQQNAYFKYNKVAVIVKEIVGNVQLGDSMEFGIYMAGFNTHRDKDRYVVLGEWDSWDSSQRNLLNVFDTIRDETFEGLTYKVNTDKKGLHFFDGKLVELDGKYNKVFAFRYEYEVK